jgi:hypothetical protein
MQKIIKRDASERATAVSRSKYLSADERRAEGTSCATGRSGWPKGGSRRSSSLSPGSYGDTLLNPIQSDRCSRSSGACAPDELSE